MLLSFNINFSQELPPINLFTPKEYKAENQNWSISQALNKNIYIANNNGLLEFNGARWKLYPSPNETILRSVKVIADKIYSGSYMDFGYWKKNNLGTLAYTSLSEKLTVKLIEDEQIWNIIELDNWILFQSFNRIYILNNKDETIQIIAAKTAITKMYAVEGIIYFQNQNDGIYKIDNGKSILVSNDQLFKNSIVVNIFIKDDYLLFETEDKGFYKLDNGSITAWDISSNKLLSEVIVYNSIQLSDGSFVLNFGNNGFVKDTKTITPLIIYNNLIYLVTFGVVKYYDLFTGEEKGRIKLHPEEKDFGQGGVPWGGNAFDTKNNILFVVTGNPRPALIGIERTGDNKNTNSLIAIDLKKNKILWTFQDVKHDLWDFDISSPPILTELEFDGKFYRQLFGLAMGTRSAPKIADIDMGRREVEILNHSNLHTEKIYRKSSKRYIDDIFLLFKGTETQLLHLLDWLNGFYPTIKFTANHNFIERTVQFLDVLVKIDENGKITSNLYRKSLTNYIYLLPSSAHPRHVPINIPYSLALRLRRICSEEKDFLIKSKELLELLLERNYRKKELLDVIEKVKRINRSVLLVKKLKPDNLKQNLIISYMPQLPPATTILNQHKTLLLEDMDMRKVFKHGFQLAYKRNKNISEMLCRARLYPSPNNSNAMIEGEKIVGWQCCKKVCSSCRHSFSPTNKIQIHKQNSSLILKQNIKCTDSNVIYVIECRKCILQYIGSTKQEYKLRQNGWRSNITLNCKLNKVLDF